MSTWSIHSFVLFFFKLKVGARPLMCSTLPMLYKKNMVLKQTGSYTHTKISSDKAHICVGDVGWSGQTWLCWYIKYCKKKKKSFWAGGGECNTSFCDTDWMNEEMKQHIWFSKGGGDWLSYCGNLGSVWVHVTSLSETGWNQSSVVDLSYPPPYFQMDNPEFPSF